MPPSVTLSDGTVVTPSKTPDRVPRIRHQTVEAAEILEPELIQGIDARIRLGLIEHVRLAQHAAAHISHQAIAEDVIPTAAEVRQNVVVEPMKVGVLPVAVQVVGGRRG